jgi:hypothetical protein
MPAKQTPSPKSQKSSLATPPEDAVAVQESVDSNKTASHAVASLLQKCAEKIGRIVRPQYYKAIEARRTFCNAVQADSSAFVQAVRDCIINLGLNVTIETREAGTLIRQRDKAHEMYIVLESDGEMVVEKEERHSIGDLLSEEERGAAQTSGNVREDGTVDLLLTFKVDSPLPWVIGEMGLNPDNIQLYPQRGATVRNTGRIEMVVIPEEQYEKMRNSTIFRKAESDILRERNEHATRMVSNERLERTNNLLAQLKLLREAKHYQGPTAEEALNVSDIGRQVLETRSPVTKKCMLLGYNRKNVQRACEFTALYKPSRHPRAIDIEITAPGVNGEHPSVIPLLYTLGNEEDDEEEDEEEEETAQFGYVQMGSNAGFGFTSIIYPILLKNTVHIDNRVTENDTAHFIKENRNQPLSHAELAAHSPIVSARKGFISVAEKDNPDKEKVVGMDYVIGYGDIDSYRIDKELQKLLDQATNVERHLLEQEKSPVDQNPKRLIEAIYEGCTKEDIIEQLRSQLEIYLTEYGMGHHGKIRYVVQETIKLQFRRIQNLHRRYCSLYQ